MAAIEVEELIFLYKVQPTLAEVWCMSPGRPHTFSLPANPSLLAFVLHACN